MANITPIDAWSDVPQIETTDKVLGGAGQIANIQAQALANRSLNLKNTVTANKNAQDNKNTSIDSAIETLNSGKIDKTSIVNNATTTASGKVLDGRMGKTLNDTITSNYNTLNTNKVNKSDIVTNYTTNDNTKVLAASVAVSLKTLIDGKQASGSYVLTSNVVNNYTTTTSGKVLDARVGASLKALIDTNTTNLGTKVPKSDIVTNYTTNSTTKVLSASVGYALKGLIDGKQAVDTCVLLTNVVNNYTTTASGKVLDARVGASLKTLIDGKINISDIVNNVTTTASGKVLDGRMGKTLNDAIALKVNISDIVNNATTTASGKVLDGRMGKTLNDAIALKVNISDIVNNLTSTVTNKPLSAAQGKAINDKLVVFTKSGSTASQGLVPKPPTTAGTKKFLCENATWKEIEGVDIGYSEIATIISSATAKSNSCGWFKLGNIVVNWGMVEHTLGGGWNPSSTITFTKPYTSNFVPTVIVSSTRHTYGDGRITGIKEKSVTNTKFELTEDTFNPSAGVGNKEQVYWISIGKG